jgi:transcriptional regulator with XRE-family HTH domain
MVPTIGEAGARGGHDLSVAAPFDVRCRAGEAVSRKTLSAILNGRAGISPEMAVRLSVAFDTTAESWLRQQMQHDLWLAEQSRKRLRVRRLVAA